MTENALLCEFICTNGGLSAKAIGQRFYGKKPGTWRRIRQINGNGTEITYDSERGLRWLCSARTFISWVDRTRSSDDA